MRIGIFDSGIGGLTVLKQLIKENKKAEYIYYADTKNLPYGEKSTEELITIGSNIIKFFEEKNVDIIIIACGTCSSLIDEYKKITNIKILDVITSTISFIKEKYKNVALLATKATINKGIFQEKLESKGINVKAISCPTFVPYIEGLTTNKPNYIPLITLKEEGVEAIILGCTHYPYLKEEIEQASNLSTIEMGINILDEVECVDQTTEIKIYVSKYINSIEERITSMLGEVEINYLEN